MTNLTKLYLYNNQLSDSIPSVFGNLTNLTSLSLYNNRLSGSIPSELGNLTNLTYLYLRENQLTSGIPVSICNFFTSDSLLIHTLEINNNQLCPPYPSCIEDYVGEQDTSGCD
jgi:Leucine-rich repeat (LRR) protein